MDFVILSLILLSVGIYGLLTKRELLKVFVSVELIATAATLNFVMLSSLAGMQVGEAFTSSSLLNRHCRECCYPCTACRS